tara:strand:- start:754 stop:1404 length:651 start_codon:yes stop_codon:yes gene_type:complete
MIASEGRVILIPTFIVLAIGFFLYFFIENNLTWLCYFNYLTFSFLLFSLYFFREPNREIIDTPNQMLSPADGKIVQIIDIEDSEIGSAKQISIFLSVFNIHSQYVPIQSKVLSSEYFPGKYLMAFNHKASDKNERSSIMFQTNNNHKYRIKQIAGFIARRILNYMTPGEKVNKGQRLGFIRFGSRVDIVIPKNKFNIFVKEGDKVKANQSSIGEFV